MGQRRRGRPALHRIEERQQRLAQHVGPAAAGDIGKARGDMGETPKPIQFQQPIRSVRLILVEQQPHHLALLGQVGLALQAGHGVIGGDQCGAQLDRHEAGQPEQHQRMIQRCPIRQGTHHANRNRHAYQQHRHRHRGGAIGNSAKKNQRKQHQHRLAVGWQRRCQRLQQPGPEQRERGDFRRDAPVE